MYEFNCILKTDLKNLYTNPMWWAGTIGLPLLLALVMGVYHERHLRRRGDIL